jgi:NAD(P)-dependent dehydrogenase (short-subunit alcohol dehydrogenase family)
MVTMFSPVREMSPAEFRRITEVTYLGYVYGTMAALRHMRPRNRGTILQIGSALSYRAIPLQSAYCGAKFAIRAFTDSLRAELMHEESKIKLTMIQLPAVNTPQFDWARNRFPLRPQPLPPVFQPEAIAEIVYRAACKPRRELWVGLPVLKTILGEMAAPGLLDHYLARHGYDAQLTGQKKPDEAVDNLFEPAPLPHVAHGRFDDQAKNAVRAINPSLFRAALATSAVALVAGLLSLVAYRR